MTIKKLKSIDIINVLSDLVSEKLETTVKLPTGEQFFSYFIGYGIVRFFVEGLRTDSLMLGPIRMAQLTSIVFIVVGVAGIYYLRNYQKQKRKN